ncbi:pyrroline-5-carboxylate reductase [Spongiibacter sp. KMU-158]|uniref:Pyrroline-5-carboxylate reductase n=1 Tax=Spongiibacter pelagi TaxID=2760804 RepID=A0A927BZR2_9GAMM|nr:pyrroline-5-carboxylate reductase [Spongiibacter pelagi]MBD2857392.1 pyrroline-5-carboxylate reductase [Spongiibacter pelagi]
MLDLKIGFIGGGNMAASIIGGLIASGVPAENIWASDPSTESLSKLTKLGAIHAGKDNNAVINTVDVVVMAVKPQVMKTVANDIAAAAQKAKPLVISIAAGITSDSLNNWLGGKIAIVRCMPNTPALLQCGATALYANTSVSSIQRQQAEHILSAVGINLWVESEAQLDAVTALSGSGPAYFFLLMEAMQASGEAMGLSPEQSQKLTLQTALGAARMAVESDVDAAELRRRVTSPNGTTERAIGIFEQGGLRELVDRALTGAKIRSEELAQELDS